jgi:hypothetical protein
MRKPFRLSQEALRTKNDFDAAVNAKPRLFKAQGVTLCKNYNAASCLNLSTDIHRMTTLARVKLQLFKDFGNANSSTRGLPCTHAGDIGAPSAGNMGLVVIQTHLSVGF